MARSSVLSLEKTSDMFEIAIETVNSEMLGI
jgi:hypothetical protein